MYRIFLTSLLILTMPLNMWGQMLQSTQLIYKAYGLAENRRFKDAALTYDTAFKNGVNNAYDLFDAAGFWTQANDLRKANKKLLSCAKFGFHDEVKLISDTNLVLLHGCKKWHKILKKVKRNEIRYNQSFPSVKMELSEIYRSDQNIRIKIMDSILVKYGKQSKMADSFHLQMKKIDAANLLKVKAILNRYGWRGPEDFGNEGATTIFLVIQHSDLNTMEAYLPLLRKAVKEDKALPSYLANLEDRILVLKEEPQIYGTQFQQVNNVFHFYPIKDSQNVNIRRLDIGMKPIEVYAKEMGIQYPKINLTP